MHSKDASEIPALGQAVLDYAAARLSLDPMPLDRPVSAAELDERVGPTITPDGITGQRALELFTTILAPACLSIDHPR